MRIKHITYNEAQNLKLSEYNREVIAPHVAEVISGMCKNFDTIPPITVTDYGVILDGQHRREAFVTAIKQKKLPMSTKLPVNIIKCKPEEEKELIKDLNSHTKQYILKDYIKMHEQDCEGIQLLNEWCKDKELCINTHYTENRIKHAFGASFLVGNRSDSALRNGTLVITPEDIELGTQIYNEINEIRNILGWEIPSIRYDLMAKVWRDCREDHPFKEWKREFKDQAKHIRRQIPYSVRGFNQFFDAINSAIGRKAKKKAKAAAFA